MAKNRYGVAPYHFWGYAQIGVIEVRIDEYQCARTESGATFLLAQRLTSERRGIRVYIAVNYETQKHRHTPYFLSQTKNSSPEVNFFN